MEAKLLKGRRSEEDEAVDRLLSPKLSAPPEVPASPTAEGARQRTPARTCKQLRRELTRLKTQGLQLKRARERLSENLQRPAGQTAQAESGSLADSQKLSPEKPGGQASLALSQSTPPTNGARPAGPTGRVQLRAARHLRKYIDRAREEHARSQRARERLVSANARPEAGQPATQGDGQRPPGAARGPGEERPAGGEARTGEFSASVDARVPEVLQDLQSCQQDASPSRNIDFSDSFYANFIAQLDSKLENNPITGEPVQEDRAAGSQG